MSYTNGLDKPSDYFNTKLYSGNSSTQSITGIGFQPDWVWIKSRSDAGEHTLYDSVRGATKRLDSADNGAEDTVTNGLTSFDSDGFSLGAGGNENSASSIVSWNWKASGSTASNTDGDITSSVSHNSTSGFSIGTYTGTGTAGDTVGHGLNANPDVLIVKERGNTNSWVFSHKGLTNQSGYVMLLNSTDAQFTDNWFNNTSPTTSVFSTNSTPTNRSGGTYVFYAFAEKKGYSKFGSYVANGDASGGFVYTGFKIGWLMIKRTDSAAGWIIYDSKREGRNTENDYLLASSSSAEGTNNEIDLLSNGFKPREANRNELNVSGASYVYLAFAESPFVTSTGIPTTAR